MTPVDFIPVALVATPITGTALILWGRTYARVDQLEKDVDDKVDKDVHDVTMKSIDQRLERMENKLDRTLNTH